MDKDLENLQKVLLKLKEKGEISLAYLFGSFTLDSVHRRSDIDLAIYINTRDENKRISIIDEILMVTDRPVDLLLLDDEDESPFLIQKAMKGIPLIEPDEEVFYRLSHRVLHEAESIRFTRQLNHYG